MTLSVAAINNGWQLSELEFRHVPHSYHVRGKEYPSVTHVMRELGLGFQGVAPQSALDRGNFVHEASVMLDEGTLDWSSVPEGWRGYCQAYERVRNQTRSKVVAAEWRFFVPQMGYAGTLDRIVIRSGKRGLIELKTGDRRHVAIQCGGYRYGWEHWHPAGKIDFAECWKLNDDGSAVVAALDLGDGSADFVAALRVYRRRMER